MLTDSGTGCFRPIADSGTVPLLCSSVPFPSLKYARYGPETCLLGCVGHRTWPPVGLCGNRLTSWAQGLQGSPQPLPLLGMLLCVLLLAPTIPCLQRLTLCLPAMPPDARDGGKPRQTFPSPVLKLTGPWRTGLKTHEDVTQAGHLCFSCGSMEEPAGLIEAWVGPGSSERNQCSTLKHVGHTRWASAAWSVLLIQTYLIPRPRPSDGGTVPRAMSLRNTIPA